jgi:hypothetical protein
MVRKSRRWCLTSVQHSYDAGSLVKRRLERLCGLRRFPHRCSFALAATCVTELWVLSSVLPCEPAVPKVLFVWARSPRMCRHCVACALWKQPWVCTVVCAHTRVRLLHAPCGPMRVRF